MRTGLIRDWLRNPADIGPMYPFVGWEVPLFGLCVAAWIAFTFWQMRSESREYTAAQRDLEEQSALEAAIERGADS